MRAVAAVNTARKMQEFLLKKVFAEETNEISRVIPFNFDYSSLNWLAYSSQEEKRLTALLNNPSLTVEEKAALEQSLVEISHNKSKHADTFSEIIIRTMCSQLNKKQDDLRLIIEGDSTSDLAQSDGTTQFHTVSDILKKITVTLPKISDLKTASEWQESMFEKFLAKNDFPNCEDSGDIETTFLNQRNQFIAFLLTENNKHFPDEYQPNAATTTKFPSSNRNVIGLGHFDELDGKKLLAIGAPMKSTTFSVEERAKQDKETLAKFEKALIEGEVKLLICLGTFVKHPNRLDYKEILRRHEIELTEFDVDDNKSLNLTNKQLSALLSVYQQNPNPGGHCDSGVGRTGQLRLLFALLNLQKDFIFKRVCNRLLNVLLSPEKNTITEKQVKKYILFLLKKITFTLCALRQTRYCIQTEEQFAGTLPQLLLLIAAQKGFSLDQLNTLRERLGVIAPPEEKAKHNPSHLSPEGNPKTTISRCSSFSNGSGSSSPWSSCSTLLLFSPSVNNAHLCATSSSKGDSSVPSQSMSPLLNCDL